MWSTERCVEQSRGLIARLQHSTQQFQQHTCTARHLRRRARALDAQAVALAAEIRLYHGVLALHHRAEWGRALSEPMPTADSVVIEADAL